MTFSHRITATASNNKVDDVASAAADTLASTKKLFWKPVGCVETAEAIDRYQALNLRLFGRVDLKKKQEAFRSFEILDDNRLVDRRLEHHPAQKRRKGQHPVRMITINHLIIMVFHHPPPWESNRCQCRLRMNVYSVKILYPRDCRKVAARSNTSAMGRFFCISKYTSDVAFRCSNSVVVFGPKVTPR